MKPSWQIAAWIDTATLEQNMAIYPVTEDERTIRTEMDGKDAFTRIVSRPSDAYWNPRQATHAEQDDMLDFLKQSTVGNLGFENEDCSPEGLAYRIRRVRAYTGNGTTKESELRKQLSSSVTMGNKVTS